VSAPSLGVGGGSTAGHREEAVALAGHGRRWGSVAKGGNSSRAPADYITDGRHLAADRLPGGDPPVTARPARALPALLAMTVALLASGIGTASAHVSVSSTDAAPGGFGEMTFRVPNESDTASTTGLRVQLPTDTPLAFVSVEPVPGWTVTTETTPLDPPVDVEGSQITDAVSEISWTADDEDAAIAPGEYLSFSISGGPLPDAESLTLPAIQEYSDGTEVGWIEPSVEGQDEPERPAPVLDLTAAAEAAPEETATGPAATAVSSDEGTSGLAVTALVIGVVGLLTGVTGVALALGARRRAAAPEPTAAAERETARV
jgi:uncharacterized protein YcnI